ncbi:MAG TPA: hypothetical protein DCO86_00995 [Spirochaetaceae bacterium]|nr:hypothetical protein [Spirochaetaceae bacterium]
MSFSREFDKTGHSLSAIQARIFSRSAEEGVPTYGFIKVFMHSEHARKLDDLSFLYGVGSEEDIYERTKSKVKPKKRGVVYEEAVAHWIGYFYRAYCYLTMSSSKDAFHRIPPAFLMGVYEPYHTVDIAKAVQMVIQDRGIVFLTPKERIREILAMTM